MPPEKKRGQTHVNLQENSVNLDVCFLILMVNIPSQSLKSSCLLFHDSFYIRVAWEAVFTVRGMLSEDKIEVKFYKWSRGIFYSDQGDAWNKSKPLAQSTSRVRQSPPPQFCVSTLMGTYLQLFPFSFSTSICCVSSLTTILSNHSLIMYANVFKIELQPDLTLSHSISLKWFCFSLICSGMGYNY